MLEWIVDPNIWASLLTLTFLEIVLGIDNIIFLTIITERVAENRRLLAQRLGLVRALVQNPRVLLLDESTSSLDPASTRAVERLLGDWIADHRGIVINSHDPEQARRIADRRLVMSAGRLEPA